MNKKFSTLVAGLALCTAFTANAKVENGKVYQLTNEDGKYLSVTESYTKTDSLILADAPTADIKNTDYQKSLWKVTYRFVSLANTWAYTLTNSATGRVLTLDKQAEWNFKNEGAFIAPENVTAVTLSAQLDNKTVVSIIAKDDVEAERTDIVTLEKGTAVSASAINFTVAAPAKINMTADLLNNKYGSPFALTFDKNLDGNPLAGKELFATDIDSLDGYVTLQDRTTGKYLVVDSTSWSSNLSSEKFWKLTVDAQPKDEAAAADKATGVTAGTILENGRAKELYAFKVVLDPSDNSKMILYPYATPVYKGANDTEKKSKMCYEMEVAANGEMIAFGNFAGTEKLTIWTKDAAKCTFAEVKLPTTLDPEYTYFVKDMNNAKSDEDHSANKNKGKYYVFSFCENGTVHAGAVTEVPTALWYLTETNNLANMWNTNSTRGGAIIRVIDDAKAIYSFGTDTVQLVKGPKVEDAQELAYKKVSKEDLVNGALSFRLKSDLLENLYVTVKDGKLYVAAGELASAYRFKVEEVELDEANSTVAESNGVKVYKYNVTDRLGKATLCSKNENGTDYYLMGEPDVENGVYPVTLSFLSTGVENEYKLVSSSEYTEEYGYYGSAISALAGSGMLYTASWCNTENTTFEFAKKDAPTYATLNIGHVQITSYTEDDNKMIASQKDGFAVLKAEGQSILKSDVYTHDSLTLWLDTACLTFEETMPLYYLSTNAFAEEGVKTRNYLMNTLDSAEVKGYAYEAAGAEAVRAAFIAGSVCGIDSIAIKGDTINAMNLNPAAVAFEVAAEYSDEAYKILSVQEYLNPAYDEEAAEEQGEEYDVEKYLPRNAYLAHLNNVVYWTTDPEQAEVFKVMTTSTPTSNDKIAAESAISVIANDGTVTIQGAAGKSVVISNILGKVVAETVLSSDNATIAVPAGIVAVAVEGEAAVKVVVK
ncbi:DUF6383 domain-containing protein [Parabacteroides distasonis]|uniref:DUF6383 domain-containing protein n=1 Tax=Parabacteroides distasonis TaxID=823 RepID=UPI001EE0329D|nr:DUF6383 domain-containing protein [Parabacteroides distasonis]MCG4887585.1 DUF6383 domain-containing protein [Parabacteroides distasonis]